MKLSVQIVFRSLNLGHDTFCAIFLTLNLLNNNEFENGTSDVSKYFFLWRWSKYELCFLNMTVNRKIHKLSVTYQIKNSWVYYPFRTFEFVQNTHFAHSLLS